MARTVIMDHPLIQHKIGIIRKKDTSSKEFREMISEIAMLMCYEATRELPLTDVEIETPICKTTVKELEGKKNGSCADPPCRSWYGRRYAGYDSGSKNRTHRSVP